jgi:hypothetical protein
MTRNSQGKETPPPPPPTQEQAKQVNKLEKARDNLHNALAAYRSLLKDTTLSDNKGHKEKTLQMQVFSDLNQMAGDLEVLNMGEGLLSLTITSLNSILTLRDEINQLRFQNFMLNKKLNKYMEESTSSAADEQVPNGENQ